MKQKAIQSILLLASVAFLIYWGDPHTLHSPKLYLYFVISLLALYFQPEFQNFEQKRTGDFGTARQIMWTVQGTQGLALGEAFLLSFPESFQWTLYSSISLGVMCVGLALRTWAVHHLGVAFTWHIDPDKAPSLITDGPYRFMRHPSYVGAFFLYSGAVIFFAAYYSLLVAIPLMLFAFSRRIVHEDHALEERFGEDFVNYSKRMAAISPRFWKPKRPS